MSISYKGYNKTTITMERGSNLTVGAVVTIDSSETVVNAASNSDFIGICTSIRDKWTSVQTTGYIELHYTGTDPSRGYSSLVSAGGTSVKVGESSNPVKYKVIKVDTANKIVGFIL